MKNTLSQNMLAVGIAGILAFALFFVFQQNGDLNSLQANIIGAKQEPALGEVVVNVYEKSMNMTANIAITDIESMSMFVFYSADEVSLDINDIQSSATIVHTDEGSGRSTLIATDVPDLSIGDEIFMIPLTGDASRVTISDVVFRFSDGEETRVSVSMK